MDVLTRQMQSQQLESGSYKSRLIDALNPDMLSSQKKARQYVILSDAASWSLVSSNNNQPGSTNTIQINNKGVLDLRNSYIEFSITHTNSKVISPVSFFECLSWQIGSRFQVNNPYPQPLLETLFYREDRDEIARQGIKCEDIFVKASDQAGLRNLGISYQKYQLPFSALCPQFDAMEHAFISLGQPLQIQLRLRKDTECLIRTDDNGTYTITGGRLLLTYVDLDQISMDKIIRSKIQFNIPRFQCIPVQLGTLMNFTFPVNSKDYLKYILLTTQQQTSNVAALVDQTLRTSSRISGVIHPTPPIRRLQIILGEQQLNLVSTGLAAQVNTIDQLNLSDFGFAFQYNNMQSLFSPFILDLTRFGLENDYYGSQVQTQSMIITVELEATAQLPFPYTSLYNGDGINDVQFFAYMIFESPAQIVNGLYDFE